MLHYKFHVTVQSRHDKSHSNFNQTFPKVLFCHFFRSRNVKRISDFASNDLNLEKD